MNDGETIASVLRACERARAKTKLELTRGVDGLAAVCRVGPWLGVGLVCIGIVDSFQGVDGNPMTLFFAALDSLGEAMKGAEIGLVVGLGALVGHRYLTARVEAMDLEMKGAGIELANALSLISRGRGPSVAG
jgi:biopolymer transport protein ExbB/TolQ